MIECKPLVGLVLGISLGLILGLIEGDAVGELEGKADGFADGLPVGVEDGDNVGGGDTVGFGEVVGTRVGELDIEGSADTVGFNVGLGDLVDSRLVNSASGGTLSGSRFAMHSSFAASFFQIKCDTRCGSVLIGESTIAGFLFQELKSSRGDIPSHCPP